uniref:LITAF domain-containing protein n=1 Tax=Acrobeloides nanus TaxID=290746 RepID=A0A914CX93_9BILA
MAEPPPSYEAAHQLPNFIPEHLHNQQGVPIASSNAPGYNYKSPNQQYPQQGCQCQCQCHCPPNEYGHTPGMYPQQIQPIGVQPGVVVPQVPQATIVTQFGPEPITMICPYCQKQILTQIDHVMGALSWIMCMELGAIWLLCDGNK